MSQARAFRIYMLLAAGLVTACDNGDAKDETDEVGASDEPVETDVVVETDDPAPGDARFDAARFDAGTFGA